MALSRKLHSKMRIGQKVWLLDQEYGDSECETPYVITEVRKAPESVTPGRSTSKPLEETSRHLTGEPDISRSPPTSDAAPASFGDTSTSSTSTATKPSPSFPSEPIINKTASSRSNDHIHPPTPSPVPGSAYSSLALNQRSPSPDPDSPGIQPRSVTDKFNTRPRQPITTAISLSPSPRCEMVTTLATTTTLAPDSVVYLITPESPATNDSDSARPLRTASQSRIRRHYPIHVSERCQSSPPPLSSQSEQSTPRKAYLASQLKPIRYRCGHILRVSCNWDERTVTRVYVRGGETFYDLLGYVDPFPRPSHLTDNDLGDDGNSTEPDECAAITSDAAQYHGTHSMHSPTSQAETSSQTPREPLNKTMPSLQAQVAELLESQNIPAEYLRYTERKLRRFRGDTTKLGEVGEVGKMGRVATGKAKQAKDREL